VRIRLEGSLAIAIGIPFALLVVGCSVGLLVTAHKARKLSQQLGGDPPYIPMISTLGWLREPAFWEYFRRQSRQPGAQELARLMHRAEVFLTIRMVLVILVLIAGLVHAILT
jgi:hypothetical protein